MATSTPVKTGAGLPPGMLGAMTNAPGKAAGPGTGLPAGPGMTTNAAPGTGAGLPAGMMGPSSGVPAGMAQPLSRQDQMAEWNRNQQNAPALKGLQVSGATYDPSTGRASYAYGPDLSKMMEMFNNVGNGGGGENGNGGAASPYTPPGTVDLHAPAPPPRPDSAPADAAIYARGKEQVGQGNRASLTALRDAMSERGVLGSGMERTGTANVIRGGQQQLGELARDQVTNNLNREWAAQDRDFAEANTNARAQYSGQVDQRGQTIGAGVTTRGQDIGAGTTRRGQDLDYRTSLRNSLVSLMGSRGGGGAGVPQQPVLPLSPGQSAGGGRGQTGFIDRSHGY
jgi:hypothetical protein